MRYSWPGNVRELQNAVQHAAILCRGDRITRDDLPPRISGAGTARINLDGAVATGLTLDALEHEYIRATLASVDGNKSEAAAILGIDRKTLYRKLEDEPEEPSPKLARVSRRE
jgi:DNA-binding NtrC family response regulator